MADIAKPWMLPQLKNIWRVCFGDTAQGTDFVFEHTLSLNRMLVSFDNAGQPVAMLNWKPLEFTTPGARIPGGYIYGIATLPEHRGRGLSSGLIRQADEVLRGQAAKLSCLIPADKPLFGFYAARGFETRFYYKLVRVESDHIPPAADGGVLTTARLEDFECERAAAFGGRTLFGAWGGEYLGYITRECRFYGGEVLLFSGRGKKGYAVCYRLKGGEVLVKETTLTGQYIPLLLALLDRRYRAGSYQLRLPADFELPRIHGGWGVEILPFGMVKWYDSEVSGAAGGSPWFAHGLDV